MYSGVGLLGHMVTLDLIFEELSNCFPEPLYRSTILHFHQQYTRALISPHSHQHLLMFVLLILAITVSVKWYLVLVLICISQMTNIVEHLFIGYLCIFFGQVSIQIICPFLFGLFVLFLLVLQVFYMSRYKSLIKYVVYKCSISFSGLFFYFLNSVL